MTPTLDRIIEALATFGQAAAVLGLLFLVAGLGLPASMFAYPLVKAAWLSSRSSLIR